MNPDRPSQFVKPPSGNLDTGTSTSEHELRPEQRAAIRLAAEVGRQIQQTCTEIAIDYTNGLSLSELVEKYDIQERFGINKRQTARVSVMNALKGYSGSSVASYPGLIKDLEILEAIRKKHRREGGKKTGELTRDEGRGIFGITKERRREISTKAGTDAFQAKIGIHAPGYKAPPLSFETRVVIGKKSALTRGYTTLPEEAEIFIRSLDLSNPEYQYSTRKGQINIKKITEEVNKRFYPENNGTNVHAVSSFLRRMKKRDAPQIGANS